MTKAFPGVLANDHVDLVVHPGEVHCLLGENGAGKSTLMNILSGMLRPDAGSIRVRGGEVAIDSPRKALELGIGMVYQHSTLIPTLSVLENLMLGSTTSLKLDIRGSRTRLAELASTLGVEVDPNAQAGTLALGQQQQVEIIKALWRGSEVLILDEPTTMLPPQGVAELAKVLRRLKERGLSIILITHKLHEAIDMGDRVSILKLGRLAGSLDPETLRSTTTDELRAMIVRTMFGEEASGAPQGVGVRAEAETAAPRSLPSDASLELIHVSVDGGRGGIAIEDVSLSLRSGEILGIAGVDGNGQRELAEAIAGHRRLTAGEMRFEGRTISTLSPSRRERLGLRYVTDDRMGEGTVAPLSVALNLVAKRIGQPPFWRRGIVSHRAINETAFRLVEQFDVRTPSVATRLGALSGGNVQKVLLARELSFEPGVVIYNKPTYGLDVRTANAVRARIRNQAEQGVAAIVISTDLEELRDLCDRIAVIFRGRVTEPLDNVPGIEQRLGGLMMGGHKA